MTHAVNTETKNDIERRMGTVDRRANDERRNHDRMSHMKGECRSNTPRRGSDMAGKMVEGELWWSGF